MSVARVGVLGAGTMGRGIAQLAALGGYETVLYDVAPNLAEAGAAGLRESLDKGASRGANSSARRPHSGGGCRRLGPQRRR